MNFIRMLSNPRNKALDGHKNEASAYSTQAAEPQNQSPAPRNARSAANPCGFPPHKGIIWSILAIALLAAVVRFWGIGRESFWSDELFTVAVAADVGRPVANPIQFKHQVLLELKDHFWTWKLSDQHPPAYDLILRGWISIFGDSEVAVRSLSAVFGTLIVMVSLLLARINPAAGVIFALGTCFSGQLVEYSQEGRSYELVALLSSYVAVQLAKVWVRWNKGKGVRAPDFSISALICMALLMWTHYYGIVFSGIVSAIHFWMLWRSGAKFSDYIKVCLPYLLPLIYIPFAARGILIKIHASPAHVYTFLQSIRMTFYESGSSVAPPLAWTSWLVLGFALFAGPRLKQASIAISPARQSSLQGAHAVTLLLVVYGVAMAFALRKVEFFNPRYLIIMTPLYIMAMSMLLSALFEFSTWRSWTLCLILLSGMFGVWTWHRPSISKEQYREAAIYIGDHFSIGDKVVGTGFVNRTYYAHYLKKFVPVDLDDYLESVNTPKDLASLIDRASPPGTAQRKWFIYYPSPHTNLANDLSAEFDSRGFSLIEKHYFYGIGVLTYRAPN